MDNTYPMDICAAVFNRATDNSKYVIHGIGYEAGEDGYSEEESVAIKVVFQPYITELEQITGDSHTGEWVNLKKGDTFEVAETLGSTLFPIEKINI